MRNKACAILCSAPTERLKLKLTLNTESAAMLIEAKEISNLNFNSLLKEAMQLLLLKYKHEDQNDRNQSKQHNQASQDD